ncbi:sulfatase-like hydrolase/transferase [Lentisphaera profundi]|uniref:Sulfatase-like hydrolase/transferase n=1 Tax=Lentisphaera profundi TaxID=1658616 RepID=A0ABY7VR72_9BACT|nr:sulfatase-like hydrolase/transferase [Lentisphaera profundi]WDE96361.1 sulfatase-like hydrolase/transferase [Lentisphaera profundi]
MSDLKSDLNKLAIFRTYYGLTYLILALVSFVLFPQSFTEMSAGVLIFNITIVLSYTFLYMLPLLMAMALSCGFNKACKFSDRVSNIISYTVMILSATFTSLFFYFDSEIFKGFGFHINSFIWNIISTPGGLDSMGGGYGMPVIASIWSICFGLIFLLMLFFAIKIEKKQLLPSRLSRKVKISLACAYVLIFLYQGTVFGLSHFQAKSHIVSSAYRYPGYISITFRSFLIKKLGMEEIREKDIAVKENSSALNYPSEKIQFNEPKKKLNIVWLVAESWRYGTATEEVMPTTFAFKNKATVFEQHYSGGNGTRMGMFSMFYGLYGPYWFKVLNERRSPVLLDVLQEQNYQMELFTSAKFSYPEFDKTIFSNIPKEHLHPSKGNGGYLNDRKKVTELLNFIDERDQTKPFMFFMFFESPHAPYTFPEDLVVKKDYLEHTNYAMVDIKENIELIYNRYLNSIYHLDTQHKRILDYLEEKNLMENTIVIMTGDHGEEFMEAGRWGHNSEFHQDQIRVPFILWVPGQKAMKYTKMSSHLDLPALLAPHLGISNKPEDYSLGHDLLGEGDRQFTVVSSWNNVGLITEKGKIDIPLSSALSFGSSVTSVDDKAVSKEEKKEIEATPHLMQMFKGLSKFLEK